VCGIAGIVQLDGSPLAPDAAERMASMLELIRERGPDASGTWTGEGALLGHRRLRIIDLSPEADQPMISFSGDEVVVFNGEIYNHHLLRSNLGARGHRFRTRTDTEVLLHGYQEWGEGLVGRLSGMFAFALFDRSRRRLVLARDRVGKKPLYYTDATGTSRFVFGSSATCVVAGLDTAPEIDYYAIYDYLGLFSVPEDRCIYRGLAKLPPAHYAVLDLSEDWPASPRLRLERYWSPQFQPKIKWNDAALDRVEDTLRAAVGRRLESDVPLAVFLSGGIDSSLVTAFAATERPGVTTISARFTQASHDEGTYARAVAERFGTDHHEVQVRESSIDVVPELVWQYGEPFADSSSIAQYEIAKAARELATVVLTGDGGDELFGGYRRYTLAAPQIWFRERVPNQMLSAGKQLGARLGDMFPASIRDSAWGGFDRAPDPIRGALGALDPVNPPYFLFHTWFLDRGRLLAPEFRERLADLDGDLSGRQQISIKATAPQRLRSFDQLLLADLDYWLPADMLTKVDVATMAASIEARSPLLDHQMVELAALIDWRGKVGLRQLKKGLRELAARLLPPEVVSKPKWGFVVPVDDWIRGDSRTLFREVLLGDISRSRGLFDYAYVERVLNAHLAGKVNHKHRLWSLFALELWFRMFVDGTLDRGDALTRL
jgi:asparagine synthase (glutamine-hydrolysing)